MATVTAQEVKDLRDKTGAGMMDCKKALIEADGDMEKAIDELRKSGIAKVAKKAGRTAKEGRVVINISGNTAAAVEVLVETDFVAKSERYLNYVEDLANRVISNYNGDGDLSDSVRSAETDSIGELCAVIGENIQVRRVIRWNSDASLYSYLHMGGRIGVLADVAGDCSDELLKDICMHIAAFNPRFISDSEISADVVAKEREIAAAQVGEKPANMIEKIVDGKISKWYSEVCLEKQPWIRDDKSCLAKVAPKVKVRRFLRWEVGEEL